MSLDELKEESYDEATRFARLYEVVEAQTGKIYKRLSAGVWTGVHPTRALSEKLKAHLEEQYKEQVKKDGAIKEPDLEYANAVGAYIAERKIKIDAAFEKARTLLGRTQK